MHASNTTESGTHRALKVFTKVSNASVRLSQQNAMLIRVVLRLRKRASNIAHEQTRNAFNVIALVFPDISPVGFEPTTYGS